MSRPIRPAITHVLFRHAQPTRPLSITLAALLVASLVGVTPADSYAGSRTATPAAVRGTVHPHAFGAIALSFEPNRGQAARGTTFLARGHGYSVAINATGVALTLNRGTAPAHPATVRVTLVGANRAAVGLGTSRLPGTVSYLSGRRGDRNTRLGHIPTYAAIRYRAVYPGVDLVYYGNAGRLEYDLRVAPGADPGRIRLAFGGATPSVAANGDLLLHAGSGVVRQHRPVIYQIVHGVRRHIGGDYVLSGHTVRIWVGAYDRHAALVIDPVLVYSTYYGGGGADHANGVAVDGQGNVYVVGTSTSGFPVQTAFVSKFDPTGAHVLWTQYLNNRIVSGDASRLACDSNGTGIGLDGQGNVYVTGMYKDIGTQSWDSNLCDTRAILWMKIDPADSAPLATHFGTCSDSKGLGDNCYNNIAVDAQGNAYITGATEGTAQNFPVTQGAFQTTPGIDKIFSGGVAGDAFVLKIDPSGNEVYGTFLGGSGLDAGLGIAVDSVGDAVVVGTTGGNSATRSDYPVTPNALQTQPGNFLANGFVSELSADGSQLLYSSFLSGNNGESVNGVAVDGQGYIYAVGSTNSESFPSTSSAFQPKCGTDGICNATKTWYCDPGTNTCYWQIQAPEDAFLVKLDPRQSGAASLVYSTFLGGSNRDLGNSVAVDGHGAAYITGRTASLGDFPTRLPVQGSLGGDYDAFVAKIDTTQSGSASLIYATYLGGSGYDEGDAIAVDASSNAYVAGYTSSTDFPTQNAAQAANNGGGSDGFLAKLGPQAPIVVGGLTINTNGGQPTGTITLNAPAPAGGATVALASGNPAATVPASVVAPAGATSATFTITPHAVGAPTAVTITASYGGVSQSAQLTITPAAPSPTATSTNTPSPTSTPPSTNTPSPTRTSTASPTNMPTLAPTTPAAGSTPRPATSPTPTRQAGSGSAGGSGSNAGAPGSGTTTGGAARGTRHDARLSLTVARLPARVAGASVLAVSGHTGSHAHTVVTLSVTATRVAYTGKGKHRKRVARTVVVYRVAARGSADGHGRFTLHLRIGSVPHLPVAATLTVQASAGRLSTTRTVRVLITLAPRHRHAAQHH